MHELVNEHRTVRKFLGHTDIWDHTWYGYQTMVDNVSLLTPEVLGKVSQLIAEKGHALVRKRKRTRKRKDDTNDTNVTNVTNGTDGTNGADVTNGADGANDADGANGTDGTDGANGTDGADGADGADGTDGADGANDADDRGRRRSDDPLRGRCDSFVVKTDVHYPTDVHLLWDAMRCLVRDTGRVAVRLGVSGWRQWQHGSRKLQQHFPQVRQTRRARPEPVKAYLDASRAWVRRAEEAVPVLRERGVPISTVLSVESYLKHARRQIHQVDRRLLKGEKIPQSEKVFSIFEEHTRWCVKGKAGVPVELGVPVAVLEDQHGFLLHHRVLWEGGDVDHAVPMIREAQARFPDLRLCSFDRGFHSPSNRITLDELLEHNVLPKKGKLGQADRKREADPTFRKMRRQHPAVESAIHNLEQRGRDRVRS